MRFGAYTKKERWLIILWALTCVLFVASIICTAVAYAQGSIEHNPLRTEVVIGVIAVASALMSAWGREVDGLNVFIGACVIIFGFIFASPMVGIGSMLAHLAIVLCVPILYMGAYTVLGLDKYKKH